MGCMNELNEKTQCKRCGTCCRKGGPSLHIEDKELVDNGKIALKNIFTIREGEPVNDNIRGIIHTAKSDIIKIKGKNSSWECIFFNNNNCKIYRQRPIECRSLKCWDTREIEKIYLKGRLTRKDLVSEVKGLWDLVLEHDQRCSYKKIRIAADCAKESTDITEAVKEILDIIKYDLSIRSLVKERGKLDPEILDFLFGRPILKTIKMFGYRVQQKQDRFYLSKWRQPNGQKV